VPANLHQTGSTPSSVTLQWDDVGNESGYKIYRWNGLDFVYLASVGANITSFTDTGLLCGETYGYNMTAYNGYGESARTSWINASAGGCTIPEVPANLRQTGSTPFSITLHWDDVGNESGYKIYRWNGLDFVYLASVGANVTSFTNIGLLCGETYGYNMTAYNGYGETARTSWINASTGGCGQIVPMLFLPIVIR
jgi:fibronectin type 3 domain-containing protein